jgi:hypothetical protein
VSPQLGAEGLAVAGAWGNRAMSGAAALATFQGVAARPRPERQLPTGASHLE